MRTPSKSLYSLLLATTVLVGAILLIKALPARAHMALSGWLYPPECCNEIDCSQLQDGEVRIGPGYYIWNGRHIAFKSPKIRPSPDRYYHACENGHWGDTSGRLEITCFFVPAGG